MHELIQDGDATRESIDLVKILIKILNVPGAGWQDRCYPRCTNKLQVIYKNAKTYTKSRYHQREHLLSQNSDENIERARGSTTQKMLSPINQQAESYL